MNDRLDGYRDPLNEDALLRRAAEESLRQDERMHALSAQIEIMLRHSDNPLGYLLATAHNEAVEAMLSFVDMDVCDLDKVRALQNRIIRYRDMCAWIVSATATGKAIYNRTEPEIRQAWFDNLGSEKQDV